MHEAALRQDVGGPEVMRGQLVYLAEAARQEHIEIRVVPMAAGAHPGLGSGPFVIMDYAELPSLVLLENKTADLYLEEQADLATYKVVLRDISAVALCPERSVRLITEIAGSLS